MEITGASRKCLHGHRVPDFLKYGEGTIESWSTDSLSLPMDIQLVNLAVLSSFRNGCSLKGQLVRSLDSCGVLIFKVQLENQKCHVGIDRNVQ